MRTSQSVVPHLAQYAELSFQRTQVKRCTQSPKVVVVARALYCRHLSVEFKPVASRKLNGTHAKGGAVFVSQLSVCI